MRLSRASLTGGANEVIPVAHYASPSGGGDFFTGGELLTDIVVEEGGEDKVLTFSKKFGSVAAVSSAALVHNFN